MKTLTTNRKSISRLSAIILMSASALFLNSCQKDDMLSPGPQPGQESYNRSEVSRTKNNFSTASFTMLTIDHSSAQTNQPSYKIAINSNGTVLFTGRKNVAAIGERKLIISKEVLTNIRNMFRNSNFAELESQPFSLDIASVATSFTPNANMEEITKIDYNSGHPSKLMELRKAAEVMLDISKFVEIKKTANELQDDQILQHN